MGGGVKVSDVKDVWVIKNVLRNIFIVFSLPDKKISFGLYLTIYMKYFQCVCYF